MVRTQEAECCGAAVLSRWGWSPPLNARRHLLSSFRGGARASRLVQPMSSKEGRRIFICPATGHAVKDPVGPFCGDHGAKMFSDCPGCGSEWPLTWDPRGEKGTEVVSRFVWKREMAHSSGWMRCPTTNRPPGKAAAGGMRHGEAYQEVGAAA